MTDKPQDSVLVAIATAIANYVVPVETDAGERPQVTIRSAVLRSGGDYPISGRLQVMDARRQLSMRLRPHW